MAEKNRRAMCVVNVEEGSLAWHEPAPAPAGSKRKYVPGALIRKIMCDEYPAEIKRIAMLTNGFKNTIGDSFSEPDTDVASAIEERHNTLMSGNWSAKGESSERTTLFIQAYATVRGKSVEWTRQRVNEIEAGDDEEAKARLAAWRKDGKVVAEIARIQIENAQKRLAAAEAAEAVESADL